jgi:hypothetical protein
VGLDIKWNSLFFPDFLLPFHNPNPGFWIVWCGLKGVDIFPSKIQEEARVFFAKMFVFKSLNASLAKIIIADCTCCLRWLIGMKVEIRFEDQFLFYFLRLRHALLDLGMKCIRRGFILKLGENFEGK